MGVNQPKFIRISIHTPAKGATTSVFSMAIPAIFQSTHPRRVRQRIIAPFMAKTVYYGIDFSKKSAILAIIFKIFARMLGALLSNLVSHLHFYKSKIPVSGS